jgi:hypothetical protein
MEMLLFLSYGKIKFTLPFIIGYILARARWANSIFFERYSEVCFKPNFDAFKKRFD